jgi:hypothetical protein
MIIYKAPAVRWVNEAAPPDEDPGLTLESANEDKTVYLVQTEAADSPNTVREWVELNFEALFENELEGWFVDDKLWPENRTIEIFDEWFDIECNSVVVDTVEGPIVDEIYQIQRN